jgi:hypothetical protein
VELSGAGSIMVKRMHAGEGAHEPDSSPSLWSPFERSASDGRTSRFDGIVRRVEAGCIWLGAGRARATETGVRHEVPSQVQLQALVGLSVRVTIVCERWMDDGEERVDRTFTVSSEDGYVWLIARSGTVHGVTHSMGNGSVLHAALSQRPQGPLVIGTAELQWLVSPGQAATLPMPNGSSLRVLLVERQPNGRASYVLADPSLFDDDWS